MHTWVLFPGNVGLPPDQWPDPIAEKALAARYADELHLSCSIINTSTIQRVVRNMYIEKQNFERRPTNTDTVAHTELRSNLSGTRRTPRTCIGRGRSNGRRRNMCRSSRPSSWTKPRCVCVCVCVCVCGEQGSEAESEYGVWECGK